MTLQEVLLLPHLLVLNFVLYESDRIARRYAHQHRNVILLDNHARAGRLGLFELLMSKVVEHQQLHDLCQRCTAFHVFRDEC